MFELINEVRVKRINNEDCQIFVRNVFLRITYIYHYAHVYFSHQIIRMSITNIINASIHPLLIF